MDFFSGSSENSEQILIVDDDALILTALEMTLMKQGLQVFKTTKGAEALEILKNNAIAILICDQRMPEMSGIEVMRQAQKISPDTIRITLTGNVNSETTIEAINIGKVFQFIVKPWDEIALTQSIASALTQYRLTKANQRLELINSRQHQELEKTHAQLRHELQLGAKIYESLLLGSTPNYTPGLSIDAMTIPSREIDGDFFEFFQPSSKIFDLILGDVMGKGLPAALVATAVKTELARFITPFASTKFVNAQGIWEEDLVEPEEILSRIHQHLVPKLMHLEYFVSLFYGRFDLQRRSFSFLDCGSTKPIYYSSKEQRLSFLSGANFPLGISEVCTYEPQSIDFSEGDFFIFYSDGITEARSPEKQFFGLDNLCEVIVKHTEASPSHMLEAIRTSILEFTQKSSFDDDLTLIAIKVLEYHPPVDLKNLKAKFHSDLSQLHAVRQFIGRVCEKAPGDTALLENQLQLAINEIFCNIVIHGYSKQQGPIIIESRFLEAGIEIWILDQGAVFNPMLLEEPSFAGDKESGFGWHIIRAIADQLGYSPKKTEKGWNHLYLFKHYPIRGESMLLEIHQENGVGVLRLKIDSLDAKESKEFKQQVTDMINQGTYKHVVLDLQEVKYIDSSGLGCFLSILKLLHSRNGDLKLCQMSKGVRTIFELVSMHKIFEIYNTLEEAIESFNA